MSFIIETIDLPAPFKREITLMKPLAYLISFLLLLASTHPVIMEERIETSEEIAMSAATSQQREIQSLSQSKPVISPVSQLSKTAPAFSSFKKQDHLISGLYIKHRILRI